MLTFLAIFYSEYFGISRNKFSGLIPSEIGLTRLGKFSLQLRLDLIETGHDS